MAQLDPSIILSARSPNVVGSLAAGGQAGYNAAQYRRGNALAQFLQDNGQAIYGGDQNALGRLAQFDPQAALGIRQTQQQITAFDEQQRQAIADHAAQMTAAERQAAIDTTHRQVSVLASDYLNNDPVSFAGHVQEFGVDPNVFKFDGFDRTLLGIDGGLQAFQDAHTMLGMSQPEQAQPDYGDTTSFLNNWQTLPAVKNMTAQADSMAKIDALATSNIGQGENANPSNDIALVFSYMKVLDPTSTVREGEFATAQQTTNLPGQLVNMYNQLVVNGALLSDLQRKQIAASARTTYDTSAENFGRLFDNYSGKASTMGLDPALALYDPRLPTEAPTPQAGETVSTPPDIAPQSIRDAWDSMSQVQQQAWLAPGIPAPPSGLSDEVLNHWPFFTPTERALWLN